MTIVNSCALNQTALKCAQEPCKLVQARARLFCATLYAIIDYNCIISRQYVSVINKFVNQPPTSVPLSGTQWCCIITTAAREHWSTLFDRRNGLKHATRQPKSPNRPTISAAFFIPLSSSSGALRKTRAVVTGVAVLRRAREANGERKLNVGGDCGAVERRTGPYRERAPPDGCRSGTLASSLRRPRSLLRSRYIKRLLGTALSAVKFYDIVCFRIPTTLDREARPKLKIPQTRNVITPLRTLWCPRRAMSTWNYWGPKVLPKCFSTQNDDLFYSFLLSGTERRSLAPTLHTVANLRGG